MTPCVESQPRRFEPTQALRRQVESLSAFGVPQDDICRMIFNPRTGRPIGLKTLRKHFRQELDSGAAQATAKVVESLYRQAVGSPAQYDSRGRLVRAERPPVLSAAIYWMKTRARWQAATRRDQAAELAPAPAPPPESDEHDHVV